MSSNRIRDLSFSSLSLKFSPGIEEAFLEDFYDKSLGQARTSLALGLVLYPLFGILDYLLMPGVLYTLWFIRFAVVCPALLLTLLFTWSPLFRRVSQYVLLITALISGSGIIAMTLVADPPGSYYYYAGLILVLMWTYTILSLRFLYATVTGWALVAGYEVVAFVISRTPLPILISNSFFFITANLMGMLACYLIEYYKRRDFCQRRWLEEERIKSQGLVEQLHGELLLAGEVQRNLLPPPLLEWPEGEVICYSKPSLEIGGDFYCYGRYEDGRFALALGDASGHGIAAALLMAACLSLYRSTISQDLSPGERLAQLDNHLEPYARRNRQNCAFCYVELDQQTLNVANAGGIPPYVHKPNGDVQRLNVGGFPLGHGLGKELGYQDIQCRIAVGDSVILVSDGIVEAIGKSGEMYGFRRLEHTIACGPNGTARAMLDHLVMDFNLFMGDTVAEDDLTIAILRIAD